MTSGEGSRIVRMVALPRSSRLMTAGGSGAGGPSICSSVPFPGPCGTALVPPLVSDWAAASAGTSTLRQSAARR